jgi:hypothetical protein
MEGRTLVAASIIALFFVGRGISQVTFQPRFRCPREVQDSPSGMGDIFRARTQNRAGSVPEAFQLEAATVLAAAYSAFPMPLAWTHDADTEVYSTAP